MTTLKRIQDAKTLWSILMPHIQQPADAVFGKWTRFSDAEIEAGIIRGSKKFAPRKVDPVTLDAGQVHKYVAGVIRHEYEARKDKGESMTEKTRETTDAGEKMQAELEANFPDDPFRIVAKNYT